MIDLTPMANAAATLTESLRLIAESREQLSEPMRLLMQRGLIQAFEYNYEMAVGMMARYLRETSPNPDKHDLGVFEELIRVADQQGLLLSAFAKWKMFRHARNMTSHTYDEIKALAVVAIIPDFEREVIHLLSRLQERLAK
jgi:nucleotidyltransferase substrate binding protein (TIGR01987 family)